MNYKPPLGAGVVVVVVVVGINNNSFIVSLSQSGKMNSIDNFFQDMKIPSFRLLKWV